MAFRKQKVIEEAAFSESKLIQEAEELTKFNHKNVVKTFGVIVKEKTLVQEYCGKTVNSIELHSLVGLLHTLNETFPIDVKLKCFTDITNALTYLHSIKVIVGDLKPANVLVTCNIKEDWIFKLADIAPETKNRHHSTTCLSSVISSKNTFTYTAAFLAPEMLTFTSGNMNVKKSTACDIYSFGILMYQVLFPTAPLIENMHPVQFFMAIANNWRPSIPQILDLKLQKFVDLMRNCWSQDPCARPEAGILYKTFGGMTLAEVHETGKN